MLACNLNNDADQICMQAWLKNGRNMPAISVTKGVIYVLDSQKLEQLYS